MVHLLFPFIFNTFIRFDYLFSFIYLK